MLYTIGDLHLGFSVNKPMDKFGEEWREHDKKIRKNWCSVISEDDTVILAGDTSWAMTLDEFAVDYDFIRRLPGRKIIIQGNHDYWWKSTGKISSLYPETFFLKNNFTKYEDVHICGARGWLCPGGKHYTAHDEKIYKRDAARLRLSLDAAMRDGAKRIIAALHYPPQNEKGDPSLFTEILTQYPVEVAVYGHLHGKDSFRLAPKGTAELPFLLVSADYLDFMPLRLL